ncbi:hypothetical protein BC826DRAFT_1110624 [Russula brevipes]|nr:hypothetical protein BC826DRAFT_1110624 [Russula brevipes]
MRFCSLREAWESALELKRRPNGPGSEDPIANKRRKTDLNEDGGDPTVTTSVEFTPEDPPSETPTEVAPPTSPKTVITTEPNQFGLYRQYATAPRMDPESHEITDLPVNTNLPISRPASTQETTSEGSDSEAMFYHPFPNATVYRLLDWFYGSSSTKTIADLDRLVHNLACLDGPSIPHHAFSAVDGWRESSVKINVPNVKHRYESESAALEFEITGVHYRPLIEIIKAVCEGPGTQNYHWVPYKLFQRSHRGDVRVYTDIFNSDAMLEEHNRIQALPADPKDDDPEMRGP